MADKAVYTTADDAARHGWTLAGAFARHAKMCSTCQQAGRRADRYCPEGYGIAADLAHAGAEVRRLKGQYTAEQGALF